MTARPERSSSAPVGSGSDVAGVSPTPPVRPTFRDAVRWALTPAVLASAGESLIAWVDGCARGQISPLSPVVDETAAQVDDHCDPHGLPRPSAAEVARWDRAERTCRSLFGVDPTPRITP